MLVSVAKKEMDISISPLLIEMPFILPVFSILFRFSTRERTRSRTDRQSSRGYAVCDSEEVEVGQILSGVDIGKRR